MKKEKKKESKLSESQKIEDLLHQLKTKFMVYEGEDIAELAVKGCVMLAEEGGRSLFESVGILKFASTVVESCATCAKTEECDGK